MTDYKLLHFNTKEQFLNTSDELIQDTDVIFIKDTSEIYTHGDGYQFIGWNNLSLNLPSGYTYFNTSEWSIWKDSNDNIIFIKE